MITKNSNGEVADLPVDSQFEPGESESECGPFAVGRCKFAGQPGHGPRGSAEDVDQWADAAYDRIFGSHDISVESGVTPDKVQQMLLDAGLHYQDLVTIADGSTQDNDIRYIKAALDQGYLVIGEIAESSVVDLEFGGTPYGWNTAGLWHYVVYSGYSGNALLTHDGANITGALNGANQPRPQPRHYDASQIQNRWATIVWNDWLPRMPVGFDPIQTIINGGNTNMSIPTGWKDDGKTLIAPNGIQVTAGFRDYVLSHNWDSANIPCETAQGLNPLELSNPGLGSGTRQIFRWTVLEWTSKHGVFESWCGQELLTTITLLHDVQGKYQTLTDAWNKVVLEKNGLIDQVNQLKAQLAQQPAANVAALQQQIASLTQQVQSQSAQITTLSNKLAQINTLSKVGAA